MRIATAFAATQPQPLTPDVVSRHRFDWASRVDINELERVVSLYPGQSFWVPEADELLVIAPWRNRDEIVAVSEVSAIRRLDDLIEAARFSCFQQGSQAFVMPEWNDTRSPRFYERNQLELLEDVISFEVGTNVARPDDLRNGTPVRIETIEAPLLELVLAIDHGAFPWLWRNSWLEFQHYLLTPSVELWAVRDRAGEPVGYVGITSYAGWGHLDRVAVAPQRQGEGHGEVAVRFALARLRHLGAKRVGLSTQRSNLRSQRLYQRIGFQQTRQNDYRIYGTLAADAPAEARAAMNGINRR